MLSGVLLVCKLKRKENPYHFNPEVLYAFVFCYSLLQSVLYNQGPTIFIIFEKCPKLFQSIKLPTIHISDSFFLEVIINFVSVMLL